MERSVFEGLDGKQGGERSEKPRTAGLTMVVDWGMGLNRQRDLQDSSGPYIDFAKVAVGVSRLLSGPLLQEKIDSYLATGIEPFPGGQYLEYAETEGKLERYFEAVAAAGYRWVEVSDNLLPATAAWKETTIRRAREEFGLKVLGEVGRKEGLENPIPLSDNARICLEAGARLILLEAAELLAGGAGTSAAIEMIVEAAGLEKVMFELPGPWVEGVTDTDVHRLRRGLIDRYGTEVNIGNVAPDDLMSLEAYRRGLGVNAGS